MNEPNPPAGTGSPVPEDAACIACGYALLGLPPDGVCPECGVPVRRSLLGDQLAFSAPAYLATLHKGVFLILTAIIVQLLLVFGGIFVGFMVAGAGSGAPGQWFQIATTIGGLAVSITLLYGWWLFSEPDPRSRDAGGAQSRRLIRIVLSIQAVVTLVQIPMSFTGVQGNATSAFFFLSLALGLIGFVAWVVQYFASMLYLQWLAPRLPSARVFKRAKLLLWLGPVLYTVGLILLGLGPLIALVLYWNLLNWVRLDLKRIRQEQAGVERCTMCKHDLAGLPTTEYGTTCPECGHRHAPVVA